jgi:hypothetical protein
MDLRPREARVERHQRADRLALGHALVDRGVGGIEDRVELRLWDHGRDFSYDGSKCPKFGA